MHSSFGSGHPRLPTSTSAATPPVLAILRRAQVQQRTGLGRSAIYALMASGQFPRPIQLTAHTVGWLEHEIQHWIAQRARLSRSQRGPVVPADQQGQ